MISDRNAYMGLCRRVALALMCWFAALGNTHAAFTIDRTLTEISAEPGQKVVGHFLVTNNGSVTERVSMRVVDYLMDEHGQVSTPPPGTTERSLYPYFTISDTELTIESGAQRSVAYEVRLPEELSGSYWLAVYFEGETARGTSQEVRPGVYFGINAQVRYRSLIIVSGKGTGAPGLGVTGLRHVGGHHFDVDLENVGNVHLRPVGQLQVFDVSGSRVGTMSIPTLFLFPGSKRVAQVDASALKLQPGTYLALAVFDYGGDHLVAGQLRFKVSE